MVLVGHSFGGNAISGAADRVPARIRHLVYLDAMILEDGQTPWGRMRPEVAAERRRLVPEQGGGIVAPPPPVSAFGVPEDHPLAPWVRRRLTPHPAGTYRTPLRLGAPPGNGLPCTYIACADPWYAPLDWARDWVRARPPRDLELAGDRHRPRRHGDGARGPGPDAGRDRLRPRDRLMVETPKGWTRGYKTEPLSAAMAGTLPSNRPRDAATTTATCARP